MSHFGKGLKETLYFNTVWIWNLEKVERNLGTGNHLGKAEREENGKLLLGTE